MGTSLRWPGRFGLIVALLPCFVSSAHDPRLDSDQAALGRTRPIVYQIQVGKVRGSIVLLDRDAAGIYLGTCYHVFVNAASKESPRDFTIQAPGGPAGLFQGNVRTGKIKVLPVPKQDLIILRLPSDAVGPWSDGTAIPAGQLQPLARDGAAPARLAGYSAGFPFYNPQTLTLKLARVEGDVPAAWPLGSRNVRNAPDMRLTVIGLDPTARSMSGGLVLDQDLGFAGLILGRVPDTIGLAIPAAEVRAACQRARTDANLQWLAETEIDPRSLPYGDEIVQSLLQGDSSGFEDRLTWNDLGRWGRLFRDPAPFRYAFQEVDFDLNDPQIPLPLAIRLGESALREPARKQTLKFWINGHTAELTRDNPRADLGEHLVPGENLLIVTKSIETPDLARGLDLSGFFESNTLDVVLERDGGQTISQIVRSLPGLVSGFSVYVTIRRPEPEPVAHHARLAVRADWLERLVGDVPFQVPVHAIDHASGSEARGSFSLSAQNKEDIDTIAAKLDPLDRSLLIPRGLLSIQRPEGLPLRVAGQSLDLAMQGEAYLDSFRLLATGVNAEETPRTHLPMVLNSRLQVVQGSPKLGEAPGHFLSLRTVAGITGRKLDVALASVGGFPVRFDLAPLLQESIVNWLNSNFLHPNEPNQLRADLPSEFLGAVGVDRLAGRQRLVPVQWLVRDGWLVGTFRLEGGAPGKLRDDPIPPNFKPDDAFVFRAAGLPPALAELDALVGPEQRDSVIRRILAVQEPIEEIEVSMADAAPAQSRGLITLDTQRNAVEQLGQAFQAALLDRVRKSKIKVRARASAKLFSDVLIAAFQEIPRADAPPTGSVRFNHDDGASALDIVEPIVYKAESLRLGPTQLSRLEVNLTGGHLTATNASDRLGGWVNAAVKVDRLAADLPVPLGSVHCRAEATFPAEGDDVMILRLHDIHARAEKRIVVDIPFVGRQDETIKIDLPPLDGTVRLKRDGRYETDIAVHL